MNKNKVKLFTHIDLDGVGCSILAKLKFGDENVDITYCNNPKDANEKVKEFWLSENLFDYDKVYITDISISDKLAELINSYVINPSYKLPELKLLDHHKTALNLNKYNWCNVIVDDKHPECGTSLFCKEINSTTQTSRDEFVETVRRYDNWLWETPYKDEVPKKYNNLLYILGKDKFIDDVIYKIKANDMSLTYTDNLLLEIEQRQIETYIKSKNKKLQIRTDLFDGYTVGVVFAERYVSELGNSLCKLNPKIDFVCIITNGNKVSYRTIKDNIDVSQIADKFGGGGHTKASGNILDNCITNKLIKTVFKGRRDNSLDEIKNTKKKEPTRRM